MSVSLEGRVALRELMEQAWQQVEGQARGMLKKAVEGLLVAERDRRVREARQRGEKVYRWGYTVRKCWTTLWEYSRNKIACEERLMQAYREEGFPVTIVRPSLTYGDTQIPLVLNSWEKSYTAVDRMLRGQKMVVPGDGSSLWVVTHNTDFAKGLVGLLGHAQAIGHAFHITSDEVLTWDQLFRIVGAAVGVEPKLVHIPSDFIIACVPEKEGTLIGDKSVSVVFDNSKIKRFVPGYCATTTFAQGVRQSLAWFNADPSRKQIDHQVNATMDKLISAHEKGMSEAVRSFV